MYKALELTYTNWRWKSTYKGSLRSLVKYVTQIRGCVRRVLDDLFKYWKINKKYVMKNFTNDIRFK